MTNDNKAVTAHFIHHWGVPTDIRPQSVRGQQIAILEFGPKGKRKTWRYATTGMSRDPQAHPDPAVKVRTEIYVCTKEKAAWVDDLLTGIACYPHDYSTYFAEGDTLGVGQPLDRASSPFTGILLAPPNPVDPETLGLVAGIADNVLVHRVVGILPDEIEFAEQHGGKALVERLANAGDLPLDIKRKSVV